MMKSHSNSASAPPATTCARRKARQLTIWLASSARFDHGRQGLLRFDCNVWDSHHPERASVLVRRLPEALPGRRALPDRSLAVALLSGNGDVQRYLPVAQRFVESLLHYCAGGVVQLRAGSGSGHDVVVQNAEPHAVSGVN